MYSVLKYINKSLPHTVSRKSYFYIADRFEKISGDTDRQRAFVHVFLNIYGDLIYPKYYSIVMTDWVEKADFETLEEAIDSLFVELL